MPTAFGIMELMLGDFGIAGALLVFQRHLIGNLVNQSHA